MPCAKPSLCSSRNRLFRVPLSVKRTVPPQLSATASLPLPRATVAAFPSTAVPGHSPSHATAPVRTVIPSQCSHWRGNPSPQSPLRGLWILLRRSAPHLPQPPQERRLGRDLIIAHPTGREFPKGEGAHALSLWTLQGDGIFKGRGKFGIPLPLNGVFGYFCRCWQK